MDQETRDQQAKLFELNDDELTPNFEIHLTRAEILESHETFGKMDIYVKFQIDQEQYRTETAIDEGKVPTWDQKFDIFLPINQKNLIFEIWEEDSGSGDDKLGYVELDVERSLKQGNPGDLIELKKEINDKDNELQGYLFMKIKHILSKNEKDQQINNQSAVLQQNLDIKKTTLTSNIDSENLQRKVSEIQERLNKIQVNLKVEPQAQYNQKNIHRVLVQGLNKIAKERPANPVRELGLFLLDYQPGQQTD